MLAGGGVGGERGRGACQREKNRENDRVEFTLRSPEIVFGDFMLPWGMVISALGFFAAWLVVGVMERFRLTRHVWNLPLFFLALAVLFGCSFGLLFAP